MIGILFLVGIVVWLAVAVMLSLRIPRWVGMTKHTVVASLLLFPVILTAPFADELIGQWQFNRLCEREAVVTLNPDWEKVKRAIQKPDTRRELGGYSIPIHAWAGDIIDADTGQVFMKSQSLFTNGGFLRRHLYGLNEQATSCHPKDIQAIQTQVNLFELLKQGK